MSAEGVEHSEWWPRSATRVVVSSHCGHETSPSEAEENHRAHIDLWIPPKALKILHTRFSWEWAIEPIKSDMTHEKVLTGILTK